MAIGFVSTKDLDLLSADSEYFRLPAPPDVRAGIWSTPAIQTVFSQMLPSPYTVANAPYAATNWLQSNKVLLLGIVGAIAAVALLKRR